MLTFIGRQDISQLGDTYYRGRMPYFTEAANMVRCIPGFAALEPSDVLEIGPYRIPLVPGCDTMDNQDHGIPRTYPHDAGKTPWPVPPAYRLLVSLQVWEHLADQQSAAWQEARRVADWAVISLPYKWPISSGADHANISLRTIYGWTRQRPFHFATVPSPGTTLSRIVCLYDLNEPQDEIET